MSYEFCCNAARNTEIDLKVQNLSFFFVGSNIMAGNDASSE